MKVVNIDNFGGDYPDEKWIQETSVSFEEAKTIANAWNNKWNPDGEGSRYAIVVQDNYKLQPGFEP